jgi:hypothetical protein
MTDGVRAANYPRVIRRALSRVKNISRWLPHLYKRKGAKRHPVKDVRQYCRQPRVVNAASLVREV